MGATIIRQDKLILKGSPLAGGTGRFSAENPQPFFRQPDLEVACGHNFPENKKYSFGRETGLRILPYTMQDRYTRELVNMEIPSIVMENDFLKAEFVPALGGRLWSLFDKQRNRDILYRNPLFRPANLAIRDAWFSGGIEWNIGRLGHTPHTSSPIFAGILEEEPVLRLWEFERQTRLFWRIEFSLPEDSPALLIYTCIENSDNETKPLYWWTNTAIPQTPLVRVFSACDEVIYIVLGTGKIKTMNYGCLPDLPVLPGRDASYPSFSNYSNEYFFQNDRNSGDSLPWEAAVYEDGYTFGEMSTSPLLYRKMFCWGSGRGGHRWQDFLSMPGQEYLEVQAGLAPTQLHTADISGTETVDWVQAITAFQVKPEPAHQKDYRRAAAYVADRLTQQISPIMLQDALEQGRKRAGTQAKILSMGSGWGALENKLRNNSVPGLSFPDESIGRDEAPWAELLRTGLLPLRKPEEGPGSFVTDEAWEKLLEVKPLRDNDWLSPYHLGVISFEKGNVEKARAFWEESIRREENPWAYRNLAIAAIRAGDTCQALDYYRKAITLPGSQDRSFTEEFIPLLLAEGRDDEAEVKLDSYMFRSGSLEELSVPLLETAARIALKKGNDTLLDRIFSFEQAHIREGNTTLVEIWIEREIRRICGNGASRDEAEKQVQAALADGLLVPPKEIDFRMYTC
jgi:tetratricopeptide (TPR) repeat protein